MAPKSIEKSCYIYRDIWSSKNDINPEKVAISSGIKKFWFDCHICRHDYEQTPNSKTRGTGCPYCAGNKICGTLDCLTCLPKSCYIHLEIWSSKNKLNPEEVSISSSKKFWFNCISCLHSYIQSPNNKTKGYGYIKVEQN